MRPLSALPPPLLIALLILASKAIQIALDSQVMLFTDSAMLLLNAARWLFYPERSYVYGWFLRLCCLPSHSLDLLVYLQALMGALAAWLLAFSLHRYLGVRWSIAGAAALLFAWDPSQILHEHMVMTEASAGVVAALFLTAALAYLDRPRLPLFLPLSFFAVGLTSLRVVYVPLVAMAAIVIPLAARNRGWRQPLLALLLSLAAFGAGQNAFRHVTGRIAGREPAYHYATGRFLAGNIAPLLRAEDTDDPRVAAVLTQAQTADHPLPDFGSTNRNHQLWHEGGLILQLVALYNGDVDRADIEARKLAANAIRRDPLGFLKLGLYTWWEYPVAFASGFQAVARIEQGASPKEQPWPRDWVAVSNLFPGYTLERNLLPTPARRFHSVSQPWCTLAFLAPFLGAISLFVTPRQYRRPAAFLFLWSTALFAATCLGSMMVLRYLHPLSFLAFAALALLAERLAAHTRGSANPPGEQARP